MRWEPDTLVPASKVVSVQPRPDGDFSCSYKTVALFSCFIICLSSLYRPIC